MIRRSVQAAYNILQNIFMRNLVTDTVNWTVSATRILIKLHIKILQSACTELLMMNNYLFETC